MSLSPNWYRACKDYTSIPFVRWGGFDGILVSMHQSGTHWLKNLLAHVLSYEYGVDLPEYIQDNSIIGSPKRPPTYEGMPKIVQSHTIPSTLISSSLFSVLAPVPPVVILVRDLRYALVSHYVKMHGSKQERWKRRYDLDFSEFLKGDPRDKHFDKDIWWDIRFMNAWGRYLEKYPEKSLMVSYEALRTEPVAMLKNVCGRFGLESVSMNSIERAVDECTKSKMSERERPGERAPVVRKSADDLGEWYSEIDKRFVEDILKRHLNYNFGYDFTRW